MLEELRDRDLDKAKKKISFLGFLILPIYRNPRVPVPV